MEYLQFPNFDPIALEIGPIVIRWYALAYIAGLMGGWQYCMRLAKRPPNIVRPIDIDDFVVWATAGVILGGRLGFVLFYRPDHYLANPLDILMVWQGGMSFHGGLLGVTVATLLFARRRGFSVFPLADLVCAAAPIGLFFGRIANFINGELWGRATDVPWAMVFPHAGPEPRHPSQLYEAALEGALLFAVMAVLLFRFGAMQRPRLLSGSFFVGYGLARSVSETMREPTAHLDFMPFSTTFGQWLSLPMVLFGLYLIVAALRRPSVSAAAIR